MEDMLLENEVNSEEGLPEPQIASEQNTEVPSDLQDGAEDTPIDYAALAAEDLKALKSQFPALRELSSLASLSDPIRYAELREMGLSPKEAYLATGGAVRKPTDNRAHLLSAVPRASALTATPISGDEMAQARRLFSDLSDAQIHQLYKKVTN